MVLTLFDLWMIGGESIVVLLQSSDVAALWLTCFLIDLGLYD